MPSLSNLVKIPRPLTRTEVTELRALQDVDLDSVWPLLETCPLRELVKREVLLFAGQANDRLYFLLEGRLTVRPINADSEPVATVNVGDAVGELSVIDKKPASAFVLADEPSRVLSVNEEVFWKLVEASHAFSKNIIHILARRFRNNSASLWTSLKANEKLAEDATVDSLTGIYNRRWIGDRLARILNRTAQEKSSLALLMLDVDHFKRFNDTYGHPAGDAVLVAVARAVVAGVRPTDLVARYGGEEFIVVLPKTDLPGARAAAEHVRQAVSHIVVRNTDGSRLPAVTISIGIAESCGETAVEPLVARADVLLYEAKKNGRNRVEG